MEYVRVCIRSKRCPRKQISVSKSLELLHVKYGYSVHQTFVAGGIGYSKMVHVQAAPRRVHLAGPDESVVEVDKIRLLVY